jgi:phosphoglycerate dehydrogenase-like enzyme
VTIVLLETIHEDAHALLEQYGQVRLGETPEALEEVLAVERVEAIVTRGRGQIQRPLFGRCPDLRVVARCGVGLDNIDVRAAAERSIPVIYAPGSTTTAVAEHTVMLMLVLARGAVMLANEVAAGNWFVRNSYIGFEVAGKTLGIVGLGEIGRRVAELGAALGMQVVYWSRRSRDSRWPYLHLADLLATSDVLSLHVALTSETHHLIDEAALARIKPGALLVNTTRGSVIDQDALAAALERNQLAGFAADVLEEEPPNHADALLRTGRVVVTPHVAALTDATYRAMCVRTARNVLAILRGDPVDERSIYKAPSLL